MKRNKNIFGDRGFLSSIAIVFTLVVSIGLVFWLATDKKEVLLSYSEFVKNSSAGNIAEIAVQKENQVMGVLRDGTHFISKVILTEGVLNTLVKQGANVTFDDTMGTSWLFNVLMLMVIFLLGILCYFAFTFLGG